MRDPFFFKECSLRLETLRNRINTIEIQLSLIVWNFSRIFPRFIDGGSNINSMFFCELKIHITKFWCLMGNAGTISISDKIGVIDFKYFLSFFTGHSSLVILVITKRWLITQSHEFFTRDCSKNLILTFSFEDSLHS